MRGVIAFVVTGLAEPAGSKRAFVNPKTGRAIVTDANRSSAPWKREVAEAARAAMNGDLLIDGPINLTIVFHVPRPKGHFGKRGLRPSAPPYPAVKPDLLKLARGVEDALVGVVYRDDSQIVIEQLRKLYGEPARCEIFIARIHG
jgi:Holliday junction resolvase RusA-like endonuclease